MSSTNMTSNHQKTFLSDVRQLFKHNYLFIRKRFVKSGVKKKEQKKISFVDFLVLRLINVELHKSRLITALLV